MVFFPFFLFFLSAVRHIERLILIRPSRHSHTNNCILPATRNILFKIKTSYHAWMQVWNSVILLWNTKPQNFTGHSNVTEIPRVQGGARTLPTDFPFSHLIILLSMSPRQFSFSQERFCHSNILWDFIQLVLTEGGKKLSVFLELPGFGKPPNTNQWIQVQTICFINS